MNQKVKDFIHNTHRFFKSLKLTASVIALLVFIYFLGLVLPQKWMFDTEKAFYLWMDESPINGFLHTIGFTDIYMSPMTVALLTIFFINLIVVTINRVPLILRRAYLAGDAPSPGIDEIRRGKDTRVISCPEGEDIARRTGDFFRKRKWFFRESAGGNTFTALKNRLSPIGFMLFHVSFILCLIGGMMIMYTRFMGRLPLTEGESYKGGLGQFRVIERRPKFFKTLPDLELNLEKVRTYYEDNVPVELIVNLRVKYGDEEKSEILKVNEPINRGAVTIIAENVGVSPLFIVRGPDGRQLDAVYVTLNVLRGKEDSFRFDTDRRFKFYVKFYPDYVLKDGVAGTRSVELKNPAMSLIIENDMKKIYSGTVMMGERASFGGLTVSFNDIRYWVEFLVIKEYGKLPLVTGFVLAAIGLIMRLVFYQKRLRLAIVHEDDKTLLFIDGRSEYFQLSYREELDRIVRDLEKHLQEG